MAAPRWRRAFDRAERTIGQPLETLVQREYFAEAVMLANRVNASARRAYERNTRRVLHWCNLPAGTDVRRLHEDIWALERQVRELTKRLEEQGKER